MGYLSALAILLGSVALPVGLGMWGVRAAKRRFAPVQAEAET